LGREEQPKRNICPHCREPVTMKNFVPNGHKNPDDQLDRNVGIHDVPKCGAVVKLKRREQGGQIRKVSLKEPPDIREKNTHLRVSGWHNLSFF